jgi:hypothetical protein
MEYRFKIECDGGYTYADAAGGAVRYAAALRRQGHRAHPLCACGHPLASFSPLGEGTAACDACGVWYDD